MAARNEEIKFEIINHLGKISKSKTGWDLELNRVSWNGKEPKYDIRSWSSDHTRMGRGVTLTEEEMISLYSLFQEEIELLKDE